MPKAYYCSITLPKFLLIFGQLYLHLEDIYLENVCLAREGAELVGTNEMGMRKLAYQVEKHNRGYYTVLFYKAEGTTIDELERNLRINEDIIKFLTVKYTKNKEIAQFDKLVAEANKSGATEAEATEA